MAVKILKSTVAQFGIPDLAKAVADHKAEKAIWDAHMQRVQADAALPPIPRPLFQQYAEQKDAFAAYRKALDDYDEKVAQRHQPYPAPEPHPLVEAALGGFEIVNDDPTPEQILAAKKAALLSQISAAEGAAIAGLMPFGKARAAGLRESDIIAAMADGSKPSKDDAAHLKAQAAIRKQADAIARAATKMMAEVEDLTADTIDNWRMSPLPGAK